MKRLFYSLKKSFKEAWNEYQNYTILNREIKKFKKELKESLVVEETTRAFIEIDFGLSEDFSYRYAMKSYQKLGKITFEQLQDNGTRQEAITRVIREVLRSHLLLIKQQCLFLNKTVVVYFRNIEGKIYIDPYTRDLIVNIHSRFRVLPCFNPNTTYEQYSALVDLIEASAPGSRAEGSKSPQG